MAKYSNQVTYDIKTTLDASGITKLQSELNKVQTSLNKLSSSPGKMKNLGLNIDEVQLYQEQVGLLEKTITRCFNSRTGMLNINQFNSALKSGSLSVSELNGAFKAAGNQGKTAFNSMVSMMTNVNKQAVTVNSTMSKIANTFSNTVRWGITASIFQEMMSSVQGAVSYMKNLDESLTQIQMVTNSSKENMRELAQYANNAAQALGSTTVDYTNAVKVFVQEGFSESESKQYANLSTKLANVSEQSTAVTSDQITAYRNAFQLDYQQTVEAMDKVANVANNTASNVNELMTASQRAASVAQAVGSSQDSFLAAIATIESVTRQSAEEIGNGLKTIYQRFADIKVSGSTEDGVDYGQYAKALQQVGVDVLDVSGQFKGMDQILSELQEVWSSLDDTMKIAVGEKVAGKFQYNRFAALMNNPEYYQKALNATQNASGMMDQMNEYYMEGIEGRLKTLQAAGEQVMSTLFNQDAVEPIIEQVTKLVNGLNTIIEVAGGGVPIFTALSSLLLKAFSPQIASQVAQIATNIMTVTQASKNMKNMEEAMIMAGQMGKGLDSKTYSVASRGMAAVSGLSQNSQEKITSLVQQMAEAEDRERIAQEKINDLASQLVSKYQKKLELTEQETKQLQSELEINIKDGALTQEQIRFSAEEIYLKERGVELEQEEVELINLTRTESNAAAQAFREMNEATKSVDENLRAADTAIQGFQGEQIARGFTQALSAVTSFAFGIQSIVSWLSIMNDETASFEEKFNATLISLTMGLSMLGSAVTSIRSGWGAIIAGLGFTPATIAAWTGLTTATEAYKKACQDVVIAQTEVTIAMQAGDIESAKQAGQKVAETIALRENAKATLEDAKAKVVDTGATAANGDVSFKNVAAIAANTLAKKVHTAITSEGTIANTLYTLSAKTVGLASAEAAVATYGLAGAIAAVVAPIGLVIAAVGVIAALYIGWQESIHAASREFEKQQELLSKTKKNYSDLRDEVDTLKSSLDSIKEARTSLDDLTEGTDEWREAVRKLNDQLLTLLQTYPELAQHVKNENGVLSIDSDELDNFYQRQLDEVNHLAGMNSIQQINTWDAQNQKYIEDFSNKWGLREGISKEEIEAAISGGAVELKSGADQLNAAFAELKNEIETNTVSMNNLSDSVGTLNTGFTNYASNENLDVSVAEASLRERFGTKTYDENGNVAGIKLDFNEILNNKEFLDAVSEATGEKIVSGTSSGLMGEKFSFARADGGANLEYGYEDLLNILKISQAELDTTNKKLEENKKIYEALGVGWDEETNKPQEELSADNQAALDAFKNNKSFSDAVKNYADTYGMTIDTVEQFAEAIKAGIISVDGLSESLSKLNVNAVDLKTNINGNEFTNRVDISSNKDAMKELLNDSNMDETAFNRMARDSYEEEGGYYQQQKQKLEEDIEKQKEFIATLENGSEAFKEEQQELSKLRLKLDDLDDSAKDTTAMLLRMSNGVVKLRNNIGDISEILTDEAARGTTEWYQALDDLDKGLSEVLNIDAGTLSDEFLESGDALDYARRMAEGDMSAIDDLRIAAAQDIVQNLSIQANPEDVETIRQELMVELNQLQADIDAGAITVGTDLDTYPFIQKLNDMLAASQISEEQASNILSSIGMEATIQHATGPGYVDEIQYEAVPSLSSFRFDAGILGEQSIPIPSLRIIPHTVRKETMVDYPYIQGAQYTGPGVQTANVAARNPNYTGGYSGNPKRSGGGSGKSPKGSSGSNKDTKPKDKDKTEWDYLTDITNDLDRAAAAMEKLAKLEDRLYGANRISQIRKLQGEYKNYIKLLEQEVNLAKDHAQLLRTNAYDENGNLTVNGYAYRAGFNQVNFDAQGNLENGKAIEAALVNIVNARVDEYNAHRNDDNASYYEERVQLAQQDHEGFLKALSEYESTLGKIEEGQSEIQDYKEKIQDAADSIVDAIQEGIDDITEAIDSQRDFNKLYRDWTQGGSGYSHFDNQRRYYAEGLAGILSPTVDGGMSIFDMQLQSLQGRINDALDVIDGDSQDADDEKLSEQAAFENLQEATGAIMDNLNNIIDYYNSLLETIEEASSKMDELIDGRLESFDHLEDYLDTRLDQLKLLFGERSYEQQVQFYNQKIAVNTEKLASIGTAIEAKQVTVKALEELEATGKELSTEEREVLKNARDEVTSLQEKQLDTETQLLQDIADRLNSQLNAELDVTVSNLFGGEDIDWLSQQWELATRNSEQYLDDYNRAFELEKLQLKYQQLLNDTQDTSLITQQRITEKMNEQLKYLREKKGLTEYDVQYAEKQLEILQRRIALEDAQSNKSQMRLQRNAAGNYDFVYGADEDAVNQAAQALLASQQEAYNLSKEIYKQTYESALRAAKEIKQMIIDTAMDASLTTEQQTERIRWLMDNLGEYLSNSSIELGEISVNLYNDIAGAEQLISEENLGHLAETFELMREQSTYTTEFVKEGLAETSSNIENSSAATFDTMQNQFGATKDFINGNLRDVELSITNALGASSKAALGTLETIKQGTIDTTKGEKGIQGIIADVIGSIDENFNLSKENTLASVEEIDEGINKAYNNISGEGGYLDQYRNKTEETLDSAGDSYDSFTENSLNYTTEQLGILIETTDVWKEDLDTLNSVINDSASELKEWKDRGDAAIESAKKLITESNNIQISFGNLAVSSAITSDTLYGFGDAAREAGYAVASMSNEIRDAYYSMQQAANAAAAAYQDMINTANNAAYAANNATQAAINAQNAMNNAGLHSSGLGIGNTIVNVSRTVNAVKGFFNNFGFKSSGGGKFATGGYTGSWSDKGVDDKNGKWAILHQKELVLNADDTKNMLSTVELVRDIMSGLKSTNSSLGKVISQNNLTDTIEQRVEINATFPGVTTALEIERALTELADNAYQYSSRYKY